MHKRLVTRYVMKSAADADENQRRIEAVFDELETNRPDTVSYLVFRLEDDSFVHVSFHDEPEGAVNPITSLKSFDHFQDGHETRRSSPIDQQKAMLVGAYITKIE